ncbi:MAG: EamA family transporter [Bacillota bacterium]|nr:EamA family transporter [Bacillota bacterium]
MLRKYASLLILLSAILWASTGLFIRHFNTWGLDSMEIVELRSISATVLLLLIILCYKPRMLRVRLRDLWCFLGSGVVSVTFFNFCYYSTIRELSLSVAATLLYTSPIFVMLFSALLFREKISWRKILALLLAFSGCTLVSGVLGGGTVLSLRGLLLGLGSGLGYALYSIFSRLALNRGYSSLSITFYTFLFSSLGGAFLADFGTITAALASQGFSGIAFFCFYALLTTALAYILYTVGLSCMENSRAAVLAAIEPVAATIFGLLFFREIPSLPMFIGMLLVLSSLFLLNQKESTAEGKLRAGVS